MYMNTYNWFCVSLFWRVGVTNKNKTQCTPIDGAKPYMSFAGGDVGRPRRYKLRIAFLRFNRQFAKEGRIQQMKPWQYIICTEYDISE